ncbi:hypothetical protein I3842_05G152000 [Carya illinoinensis]|uniref:Uncharacterized protein n=1 Tax=Carya illinoinensis TaxID=32201 RepID=A0A922F354_CARIL|nr:hypothetical protein I3842_05G152000 [Carya illinoinensis]
MWAFSFSWMQNIVLVFGVFNLFIPNNAFSFDPNDCRARVLILSSFGSCKFMCDAGIDNECYLVDSTSSHMLVSKIKPCMCNYSLFDGIYYSDNRSNSRANKPRLLEGMHLLDKRSTRALPIALMIHDKSTDRTAIMPAMHHSNFCPINFRL